MKFHNPRRGSPRYGRLRTIAAACLLGLGSAVNAESDPLISELGSSGSNNHQIQLTSSAHKNRLSAVGNKYFASPDRKNVIEGQYIVVLNEDAARNQRISVDAFVNSFTDDLTFRTNAEIMHTYTAGMAGFAVKMEKEDIGTLLANPDVKYIEEDTISTIVAVQNNPTWGLDRIDERSLPLDNRYDSDLNGSGVRAYIIDTGIDLDHPNFGNRIRFGFDAMNDGRNGNDCNGHGTHVAGTVASSTWGVAKNATVYSIRVFSCSGSTATSNIIAGMNWVINNAQLPAVVNMSLGGPFSNTSNNLVQQMVNRGIVVAVAAGNSNANACNTSPASAPAAITVASSTSSDARSSFSNWGSCVDIFAPGSSIRSTWLNGGANTISGTSMASPHVAGVAALALDSSPNASVSAVTNALVDNATNNTISNVRGSPNKLLYMGFLNGGNPPPPPPPPPGGGSCAFEDDFGTSTGWTIDGASTCSTGTYIRGNPTQQSNSGVVTQVGGDSDGNNFAVFTASNSSAGNADVDGGVCIARSPSISVSSTSTLSVDWFHGQRDSGDDPGDDYYRLEYSLNGGSSFNSMVNIGDTRTQAQWATATATIPAGSNVVIRVSTSDGAGPGDLIEGGIDNVSICEQ